MADYFYASISIGGEITDEQYIVLKPIIMNECHFDDFGIEDYLWGNSCQAHNGEFEALEQTLRELKIPYKRSSEAKYEYTEHIAQFDGELVTEIPTSGGEPVIPIESAIEIAAGGMDALIAIRDKYNWVLPAAIVSESTRLDIESNATE